MGGHRKGSGPATPESITWLVVFALGFGAFAVLILFAGSLFALLPGALTVLLIVVTTQRVRTNSDSRNARLDFHATTGRITEGFPGPDQWGPAIQQAVRDAQFPAAWKSVMAGDRLEFGKFWLTKSQIGAGKKAWPWSQVNEIGVRDGLLKLESEGAWRSLTDSEVSRIPNYFVFIALAERLAATH